MVTMAVNQDGTGKSKVFIASDEDLVVNVLPNILIDVISFCDKSNLLQNRSIKSYNVIEEESKTLVLFDLLFQEE